MNWLSFAAGVVVGILIVVGVVVYLGNLFKSG